jgi:hypothetical protein
MSVDLLSLLRRKPVGHPTRITSVQFVGNRALRIVVVGWPWWDACLDTSTDHQIELLFGGISDGVLEPLDFDFEETEALEPFEVVETANLPWAQPDGFAIYCHAPLPRPLEVFAKIHDFLLPCGGVRRASHFLNCGDQEALSTFVERTRSTSYLIGNAPRAIRDLITAELTAQHVAYNELPRRLQRCGPLLVTMGRSQFLCETAEAEFLS